ncbi:hypothetical protein FRB99_007959 [Tulasnella sp. 403]|nr:hypothetical protein FRB99_007959 [Tulasnella sp. 403]
MAPGIPGPSTSGDALLQGLTSISPSPTPHTMELNATSSLPHGTLSTNNSDGPPLSPDFPLIPYQLPPPVPILHPVPEAPRQIHWLEQRVLQLTSQVRETERQKQDLIEQLKQDKPILQDQAPQPRDAVEQQAQEMGDMEVQGALHLQVTDPDPQPRAKSVSLPPDEPDEPDEPETISNLVSGTEVEPNDAVVADMVLHELFPDFEDHPEMMALPCFICEAQNLKNVAHSIYKWSRSQDKAMVVEHAEEIHPNVFAKLCQDYNVQ